MDPSAIPDDSDVCPVPPSLPLPTPFPPPLSTLPRPLPRTQNFWEPQREGHYNTGIITLPTA